MMTALPAGHRWDQGYEAIVSSESGLQKLAAATAAADAAAVAELWQLLIPAATVAEPWPRDSRSLWMESEWG